MHEEKSKYRAKSSEARKVTLSKARQNLFENPKSKNPNSPPVSATGPFVISIISEGKTIGV